MGLIQDIFKKSSKFYLIKVKCDNCGLKFDLKVPKGTTVWEFVKNKRGRCKACGCPMNIKEYQTEWLK